MSSSKQLSAKSTNVTSNPPNTAKFRPPRPVPHPKSIIEEPWGGLAIFKNSWYIFSPGETILYSSFSHIILYNSFSEGRLVSILT